MVTQGPSPQVLAGTRGGCTCLFPGCTAVRGMWPLPLQGSTGRGVPPLWERAPDTCGAKAAAAASRPENAGGLWGSGRPDGGCRLCTPCLGLSFVRCGWFRFCLEAPIPPAPCVFEVLELSLAGAVHYCLLRLFSSGSSSSRVSPGVTGSFYQHGGKGAVEPLLLPGPSPACPGALSWVDGGPS